MVADRISAIQCEKMLNYSKERKGKFKGSRKAPFSSFFLAHSFMLPATTVCE